MLGPDVILEPDLTSPSFSREALNRFLVQGPMSSLIWS